MRYKCLGVSVPIKRWCYTYMGNGGAQLVHVELAAHCAVSRVLALLRGRHIPASLGLDGQPEHYRADLYPSDLAIPNDGLCFSSSRTRTSYPLHVAWHGMTASAPPRPISGPLPGWWRWRICSCQQRTRTYSTASRS